MRSFGVIPDDMEIVAALREWSRIGEACPPETLERAAIEIKKLRAQVAHMGGIIGIAAVNKSFAEITKDLPRRMGETD